MVDLDQVFRSSNMVPLNQIHVSERLSLDFQNFHPSTVGSNDRGSYVMQTSGTNGNQTHLYHIAIYSQLKIDEKGGINLYKLMNVESHMRRLYINI